MISARIFHQDFDWRFGFPICGATVSGKGKSGPVAQSVCVLGKPVHGQE